jgi:hypothetical protein
VITIGQFKVGLCHGHQIVPWGDLEAQAILLRQLDVDLLVTGHTHRFAAHYYESGKIVVNPGSATGAFSTLAPWVAVGGGSLLVTLCALGCGGHFGGVFSVWLSVLAVWRLGLCAWVMGEKKIVVNPGSATGAFSTLAPWVLRVRLCLLVTICALCSSGHFGPIFSVWVCVLAVWRLGLCALLRERENRRESGERNGAFSTLAPWVAVGGGSLLVTICALCSGGHFGGVFSVWVCVLAVWRLGLCAWVMREKKNCRESGERNGGVQHARTVGVESTVVLVSNDMLCVIRRSFWCMIECVAVGIGCVAVGFVRMGDGGKKKNCRESGERNGGVQHAGTVGGGIRG